MDLSAWISIAALVLVIPLGVASNLLTYRFSSYLEQRKLIKTHKTRQQALQIYKRIKAFHDGKRDRYPYYMVLAGSSVLVAITACTILIVVLLVSPNFQNAVVWFAIAAMLAVLSVFLLAAVYETARQLERFDDYKKEFEARWGPIDS
jgi:cell division protein FtsW (lipid II flippase)